VSSARNAPRPGRVDEVVGVDGDEGAVGHGLREFLGVFLGREAARSAANYQGRHVDCGHDLRPARVQFVDLGPDLFHGGPVGGQLPCGASESLWWPWVSYPVSSSISCRTRACLLVATSLAGKWAAERVADQVNPRSRQHVEQASDVTRRQGPVVVGTPVESVQRVVGCRAAERHLAVMISMRIVGQIRECQLRHDGRAYSRDVQVPYVGLLAHL
jgi:hypothetical protein